MLMYGKEAEIKNKRQRHSKIVWQGNAGNDTDIWEKIGVVYDGDNFPGF